MSELYKHYDREFHSNYESLRSSLANMNRLFGAQRRDLLNDCEKYYKDASEALDSMEKELRSIQGVQRVQFTQQLETSKSDLANSFADLQRVRNEVDGQSARDLLFSSTQDDLEVTSRDQRDRLLAGTKILEESGDRIKRSHQMAEESTEIGRSIMEDLHVQRDTIIHTRENLGVADDNIAKSRRILTKMGRRVLTNKFILLAIILVLIIANFLVVYIKWINPIVFAIWNHFHDEQ